MFVPFRRAPLFLPAMSSSSRSPLVAWCSKVSSSTLPPSVLNLPAKCRLMKASFRAFIEGLTAGSLLTEDISVWVYSRSSACCSRASDNFLYLCLLICRNISKIVALANAFMNWPAVPHAALFISFKIDRSPSVSVPRMLCAPTCATNNGAPTSTPLASRRLFEVFNFALKSKLFTYYDGST